MKGFNCNPFSSRLADLFSSLGDGRLHFDNLLEMHNVLHHRAAAGTKITWAFALWDFDGMRSSEGFSIAFNPLSL